MDTHDGSELKENLVQELEKGKEELLKKLSPKFSELSLDIQQIMEFSKDPVFLAVLLFKLAEEREKTNQAMDKINEKFDSIMFALKTRNVEDSPQQTGQKFSVLPEQDQVIIGLAEKNGSIDASAVQSVLGYKGKNAASQRLNKLYKEGMLRKVQSGKKVLYLAKI